MCGLAGWFGECDVSNHQRLRRAKALEALMMANAERGTDATGVGMVHNARPLTVYKRAISSYRMMQDQYFNRIVRADDAFMAIGHTRYKTMGANKDANAHPFLEGAVLGAHNGVINNYAELENFYNDRNYDTLRVDSQAAFRMLDLSHPDNPLQTAAVLEMMEGSLALSWHDTRDPDALWLFKHWNPLHIGIVPHTRTMFWSSQPEHLAIVMQAVYGNKWEPFRINEDTLYRLTWHESNNTLIYEEWPVQMFNKYYSSKSTGTGNKPNSGKGSENSIIPYPSEKKPEKSIVFDDESVMNWERCDMCRRKVDWEDTDATYLNAPEAILCGDCMRWYEEQGMYTYDGDIEEAIKIAHALGFSGREYGNKRH